MSVMSHRRPYTSAGHVFLRAGTVLARAPPYMIDPKLPDLFRTRPGPRTDKSVRSAHQRRGIRRTHPKSAENLVFGSRKGRGPLGLSDDLRDDPGRLVYFGHVSSTLDEPGSASLHLSDDANEPGYTDTVNQAHRPLSALDLMLGTAFDEVGEAPESGPGHVIWPMPPRVAIIACEGGVDYRSSEHSVS